MTATTAAPVAPAATPVFSVPGPAQLSSLSASSVATVSVLQPEDQAPLPQQAAPSPEGSP